MSFVMPVAIKQGGSKPALPVQPVSGLGALCGIAVFIVGAIATAVAKHPAPIVVGVVVGLYLMLSLKVADQWQKVAVLRLGRYRGLRGPGLFHIIPVIDTMS